MEGRQAWLAARSGFIRSVRPAGQGRTIDMVVHGLNQAAEYADHVIAVGRRHIGDR
jgi:ABC-type enterochelin transport system ATPase subunit